MRTGLEGCPYTALEVKSRWEKLYELSGVVRAGEFLRYGELKTLGLIFYYLPDSSLPYSPPTTSISAPSNAEPPTPSLPAPSLPASTTDSPAELPQKLPHPLLHSNRILLPFRLRLDYGQTGRTASFFNTS